ncbi:PTS sugar transporter subunit IIA [Candidatus Enterococcus murrayae]|uniref:PTS glucose transporter subunit IIA n=1 Tax=Candidatus Enterococcus murrayae TaxID=2815321 RepID=A0ABS3HDI6_9ENTE|nr:PTS glucose transporter subunit IIA [Enterococcus sp. MJM16]MBO0451528.1 PTS glucose transporter subunit IIA [Enterococcus sp. MJM16]
MNLFKKGCLVYSPAKGLVKSIDEVNDEMFSTKALGDGFAVEPDEGFITAPVEGTVIAIFPTKYAISLRSKNGLEVLVHIGIDTVELNGSGFTIKVEVGEKVAFDTLLAEVDFDFLENEGKDTDVIVVFTNLGKNNLELEEGQANRGQTIGVVK